MRSARAISCVATTSLATFCLVASSGGIATAAAAGDPWAQTDYNAAQSRANLSEQTLTARTLHRVRFLRQVTAPSVPPIGCATSTGFVAPVLTGGRLFAVANGRLVSYDARTGHLMWRVNPDPTFTTRYNSVAVANGLVLVGEARCGFGSNPIGILQAFRASTGALVWAGSPTLLGGPLSQLVVSAGIVVVTGASAGGGIVVGAHSLANGAVLWSHSFKQCGPGGTVLVVRGLVVANACTSSSPMLDAYHLATGVRAWRRAGAWQLDRGDRASAAGHHLYALNPGGRVVDLRPLSGQTRVTLAGASDVLAVDGERAYARCGTADICGYRSSTGALLWRFADASSAAAEAGGVLYLSDGKALAASTGTLLRRMFHHVGGASALVIGEGRIAASLGLTRLSLYGLPGS